METKGKIRSDRNSSRKGVVTSAWATDHIDQLRWFEQQVQGTLESLDPIQVRAKILSLIPLMAWICENAEDALLTQFETEQGEA